MGNEASQPTSSKKIENDIKINWKQLSKCPFQPREGQCCASIRNKLYIFGGVICGAEQQTANNKESNQLISFDVESNKWEEVEVSNEIPEPRSGATLSAVGDKLYLFGGLSENHGWLNDMYVFEITSGKWSKVSKFEGEPPCPRDKLTSGVFGTDVYYFGGFGPGASPTDLEDIPEDDGDENYEDEEVQEFEQEQQAAMFTWFNDVYRFDTLTQRWDWLHSGTNRLSPSPRAAHTMCTMDQSLIVFGGRDSVGRKNDVWSFSVATNEWTELTTLGYAPEPRSFHAAAAISGRIVILGGRGIDNTHFKDFHVYDLDTNQWFQPNFSDDAATPPAMGLHSLSAVKNHLLLCFGTSDLDPVLNSCTTFYTDCYAVPVENILTGGALKKEETEQQQVNEQQSSLPAFLNLQPTSNSSNN
ncbi:kelch domain-containing protein 1-like [Styela clava]